MPYKFLPASLTITSKTPKQIYLADFQALLDTEFSNAPNFFTISEEFPYGSGLYRDVDVRVTHVINNKTGDKLGDDFKQILFSDISHSVGIGNLYYFDDNYWIVINTEIIKNIAASVLVRRCNNTLRWMDETGKIYIQPCVLDYLVKENRDYSTAGTNVVLPSGALECLTQLNSSTNKIRSNGRFLFGNVNNWTAYKVLGGGVNNYQNQKTMMNLGNGLMRLSFNVNFLNENTDDLINGIADVNQYKYEIAIENDTVTGQVSENVQLNASITLNNVSVSRNFVWSSSNKDIATVDSNGLVTFVAKGNCQITCNLEGNNTVNDTASITVSETPLEDYKIVIIPTANYVLEGKATTFEVRLQLNGTVQADTFTFGVNSNGVPTENYLFDIVDGHKFTITNIRKDMTNPLIVTCTSGDHVKSIEILLKGAW